MNNKQVSKNQMSRNTTTTTKITRKMTTTIIIITATVLITSILPLFLHLATSTVSHRCSSTLLLYDKEEQQ